LATGTSKFYTKIKLIHLGLDLLVNQFSYFNIKEEIKKRARNPPMSKYKTENNKEKNSKEQLLDYESSPLINQMVNSWFKISFSSGHEGASLPCACINCKSISLT